MNKNATLIKNTMKVIKDFPSPGISFKDITPIFANPKVFKLTIKELQKLVSKYKFDVIAALESRGFWLALPLAQSMGLPFVPIRKKGKLPRKTVSATFTLEYGKDTIQIHKQDIKPGSRVLIVDDVIATGGTLVASLSLMKQLKAKCEHILVLGYLEDLPEGVKKIEKMGPKVHYLLKL